jgi:hypothetical protein
MGAAGRAAALRRRFLRNKRDWIPPRFFFGFRALLLWRWRVGASPTSNYHYHVPLAPRPTSHLLPPACLWAVGCGGPRAAGLFQAVWLKSRMLSHQQCVTSTSLANLVHARFQCASAPYATDRDLCCDEGMYQTPPAAFSVIRTSS